MKKKINTIDLISVGLVIFSAICIILRTVALLTAFDQKVGYFSSTALITYLDRAFIITAIIFGTVAAIITPKGVLKSDPAPINVWSTFSSAALGFIFGIFGILFFILHYPNPSILVMIASAGAVASSVCYIYEAIRPIKAAKGIAGGLIAILTLVCVVFVENFDLYVALNSTEKILATLLFGIASLFILQNLKFRTESASPRFHLWCAYLTALLGAYFAVGGIIATSAGTLGNLKYLVYYLLSAGLSIYAFTDIFGRISLSKISPDTTI